MDSSSNEVNLGKLDSLLPVAYSFNFYSQMK